MSFSGVACSEATAFPAKTITAVYEVVRRCDPAIVARVAFPGGACSHVPSERSSTSVGASPSNSFAASDYLGSGFAAAYVASAMEAILSVEPDLEASGLAPVDPSDAAHMGAILQSPWPEALGRRISMPADEGCPEWQRAAGSVVRHLCAL